MGTAQTCRKTSPPAFAGPALCARHSQWIFQPVVPWRAGKSEKETERAAVVCGWVPRTARKGVGEGERERRAAAGWGGVPPLPHTLTSKCWRGNAHLFRSETARQAPRQSTLSKCRAGGSGTLKFPLGLLCTCECHCRAPLCGTPSEAFYICKRGPPPHGTP